MAIKHGTCADCLWNINGRCHALPPRFTSEPTEEWKYPETIDTAESCIHYEEVPQNP